MNCTKSKINKEFDPSQIVKQLEQKQQQVDNCCAFYSQYKDMLLKQQTIIQKFTLYGSHAPQPLKQQQQSYQNNQQILMSDLQDSRERAQSELLCAETSCLAPKLKNQGSSNNLSQEMPKLKKGGSFAGNNNNPSQQQIHQMANYEGEMAQLQQKIEGLEKKQKKSIKQIDELQENLQIAYKQKQSLENDLSLTEDQLVAVKMENTDLKEDLDNDKATIQNLSVEKNESLDKIAKLQSENRDLIDRIILEKQKIVEKMNELQNEENEIKCKQSILMDEQNYFKGRKDEFNKKVQEIQQQENKDNPQQSPIQREQQDIPSTIVKRLVKFHQSEIYTIETTTNGNLVATCGGDRCIKIYDPINNCTLSKIQSTSAGQVFVDIGFSNSSEYLVAGTTDKIVQIYNCNMGKRVKDLHGHGQEVNSVSFLSEKNKIVSASNDRTIKFWDAVKGKAIKTINTSSICRTIDSFPSEPHIITGHSNGNLRMYTNKENSNKPIYSIEDIFDSSICGIKISNCGNYIIVTSKEGESVKVIDIRQQTLLHDLAENNNNQYFNSHDNNKATYGPSGDFIIGGSTGGNVFFWDVRNNFKKNKVIGNTQHEGTIIAACYTDSIGNLYTGDSKGNLFIWN